LQLFKELDKSVAPGYEVFIGITLALKIDLKRKLTFLFKMYFDEAKECCMYKPLAVLVSWYRKLQSSLIQIDIERHLKVIVYKDFIHAIQKMLRLSQGVSNEVTNSIEVQ